MADPGGVSKSPPPSLWPVGFAVGIVCLLVGLIVNWWIVAIGAGIALLFGFLWARDATREYREPDHLEPEVREAAVAPPTLGAPAAEPATYPRNKFLELSTLGIGGAIGAIVTLPILGFAVLPAFVDQDPDEIDLGPLENFPEGEFVISTFLLDPDQGEVSRRTVYARNNGLKDGQPSFTLLSNRCVHLGCPVQPGGPIVEDQAKEFRTATGDQVRITPMLPANFSCPCHGGAYDTEGNRTQGPPVRALDRYEYAIRNSRLVLLSSFSVAYVEGTGANAMIRKYGLQGPGEHVDGPEAWLYPISPQDVST